MRNFTRLFPATLLPISLLLITLLFASTQATAAQEGYYRNPALHGDTVVFVSEGDLWRVSTGGGHAQRLTTHPAAELQPAISPDGQKIAFVASYDGAPDIYLMPISGGEPERLTFDGSLVWLVGFAPDGRIIYATENVVGPGFGRGLRMVDPRTGHDEAVPLADARQASFNADGSELWFTRFGLAVSADNLHGYRGGAMAQLWRWSFGSNEEAERLAANWGANITHPMWWNNQLYALADADGRYNLWRLNADGSQPEKLTSHEPFEVRDAQLHNGRIVYRAGADLHLLDLESGQTRQLDIHLDSDFLQRRARYLDKPAQWITGGQADAAGERMALVLRGQIFVAAPGDLRRVRLAVPDDARAREAVPGVDGKQVLAIIDRNGQSEIWQLPADGGPNTRVLLAGEQGVYRTGLWPSPDGRLLAHADKADRLWLLDLESGQNRLVEEARYGGGHDNLAWSADSRYLAWERPDSARNLAQIVVTDTRDPKPRVLTSDRYESFSPRFSPDGQWLYFISNRHFSPTPGSPWGDRNTGAQFDKRGKLYALALQPGLRFPFQPLDELAESPKRQDKNKDDSEDVSLPAIVFEGLSERLHELGVAPDNYNQLLVHKDRLYFTSRSGGWGSGATLHSLSIEPGKDKPETFMSDIFGVDLTLDGKRLVVSSRHQGNTRILLLDATAKAPADLSEAEVNLNRLALRIDPAQEWREMFVDAWNMHRHYSFDARMRGVDWDAVRTRYEPLVERVNDRLELDDLLGQMTAELGILHSQVRGGDYRDEDSPGPASLGARLATRSGGLFIEQIYRTDPELPGQRGPLQQAGMDVRNGDRILAINGQPVSNRAEAAALLRGQAGQQVLLELERGSQQQQLIVKPVSANTETRLRYSDWLHGNREKVQQASEGRIGYLHLYSMVSPDFGNFVRDFYAQYDRDALIIDVRRNRGGNIDSWVIEKLLRRAWAFWQQPRGPAYTNMQQAFRGHLVVLADAFTYSDGETFTAGVKSLGLGPVIGQRTAGAGIWLSDRNRLRDGGLARIAETGQFDMEGNWIVEGLGVGPDREVENKPHATATGHDAQLEAALRYLREKLEQEPIPSLEARPVPGPDQPAADVRPLDRN